MSQWKTIIIRPSLFRWKVARQDLLRYVRYKIQIAILKNKYLYLYLIDSYFI